MVVSRLLAATIVQTVLAQTSSALASSTSPDIGYRPTAYRQATSSTRGQLALIPLPRRIRRSPGEMVLGSSITIRTNGGVAHDVALELASDLARLGAPASVSDTTPATTPAEFQLIEHAGIRELGQEGYTLDVNARGIKIVANTGAGLYYGAQTLEQLASPDGRKVHAIPFVRIVDWPEYRWRGLHLDVSRHFFPVAVVERYIDVAARFKLNTFHWHLTDDQGWRIDIPKYPLLVSVGGCRAATQTGGFGSTETDKTPTCAHYTANDIREVVAFAAARHVAIIPEIEGPGHSVEALAAYPSLACAPGPYHTLSLWGSTGYTICPTDTTYRFYDEVFHTLAQLFPAPIIHVGGDEVPYRGYFIRRLEAIAHSYHRRIAGWDEIDASGASKGAIVMAWEGSDAAATAASRGHDVVMSPNPPLYFDAYQGPLEREPLAFDGRLTTLKMVYDYDPVAEIEGIRNRKHILGAQANVWTEYIPTASQLWYQVYPRALALSELSWTPRTMKNWTNFRERAGVALQRLEPLGVTFRIPEVTFRLETRMPRRSTDATVALEQVVPNAVVHYTLDGSIPTVYSPRYTRRLRLKLRGRPIRVTAVASLIGYRVSAPSFLTIVSH